MPGLAHATRRAHRRENGSASRRLAGARPHPHSIRFFQRCEAECGYIHAGQRRRVKIIIQFKPAGDLPRHAGSSPAPSDLALHIQPEEGVSLRFVLRAGGVEMKFSYQYYFKVALSTGYETLLYDCMIGGASLFQRDARWPTMARDRRRYARRGRDGLAQS